MKCSGKDRNKPPNYEVVELREQGRFNYFVVREDFWVVSPNFDSGLFMFNLSGIRICTQKNVK